MKHPYQPNRRSRQLSIQHVGNETLIYDEQRHLAFCLNLISSAVWNHCDGRQSVQQIAAALQTELAQPVTEEIVLTALAQMESNGLLEADAKSTTDVVQASNGPISRRNVMTKLAFGAVVLLPAIAVIMAPTAVQAYNGCVDC